MKIAQIAPLAESVPPWSMAAPSASSPILPTSWCASGKFGGLHFHIEPLVHFPLFRGLAPKALTTRHGRLDSPDLQPLLREFTDMPACPRGLPLQSRFVGELGERDKPAFLGNATGLLFPIDWPEPFGLAMIEAMSCGNREGDA